MKGVLDGIKVIELCVGQQGPYAGVMLGDMGADVIKIEDRVEGDYRFARTRIHGIATPQMAGERNFYFEVNNRNKRSITIDLKKERGREIVYGLVKTADVFVQNLRQGVAAELGVDFQTLSGINPKLIYASANAFGPFGPDSGRPGLDVGAQARSGIMYAVGEEGSPPTPGPMSMTDQVGGMICAFSILAALLGRERLGVSQEVHTSLLGSTICAMGLLPPYRSLLGKDMSKRARKNVTNPLWNLYKCSDDKWICLCMTPPDKYWREFCRSIGKEEMLGDPRFSNASAMRANAAEAVSVLDQVFSTMPRSEWLVTLARSEDLAYAQVNSVADMVDDPQVIENKYMVDYDHPVLGNVRLLGHPVTFTKTSAGPRSPAPEYGQHSQEILRELGYAPAEIESLRDLKVI